MILEQMMRLFPAAAALAEQEGSSIHRMTELLQRPRKVLTPLLTALAGNEALKNSPKETAAAFARGLADGGQLFLQTIRAAGPEMACTVLYQYRPTDPEALCFLLKRKQKDDFTTRYIADLLRLLAMSKMEPGTKLPTLSEYMDNKPSDPLRPGEEIAMEIFALALGQKGDTQ